MRRVAPLGVLVGLAITVGVALRVDDRRQDTERSDSPHTTAAKSAGPGDPDGSRRAGEPADGALRPEVGVARRRHRARLDGVSQRVTALRRRLAEGGADRATLAAVDAHLNRLRVRTDRAP